MDGLRDFQAAFLDSGGTLFQTMPILAETLAGAAQHAGKIAAEINAAEFFITATSVTPGRTARWHRRVPLPAILRASNF